MPFLELTLHCSESEQPRLEKGLEDIGALAITLTDADASAPDERAVLEPGVGETPLWEKIVLTALFPANSKIDLLLAALESFDSTLDLSSASVRAVADQPWERVWMDQFHPMRFGARTWVVPWNRELPDAALALPNPAIVRLDPGLAFGAGTHPTTALCLDWLDSLDGSGQTVLDYGCGSGILAIAALKLGAAHAVGIDNDPQALLASRDNAEANGVGERLALYPPEQKPAGQYSIVVANILAAALDALAEHLAACVIPGGAIALSGILEGQENALLARYAEWFDRLRVEKREGWVRITGCRH